MTGGTWAVSTPDPTPAGAHRRAAGGGGRPITGARRKARKRAVDILYEADIRDADPVTTAASPSVKVSAGVSPDTRTPSVNASAPAPRSRDARLACPATEATGAGRGPETGRRQTPRPNIRPYSVRAVSTASLDAPYGLVGRVGSVSSIGVRSGSP